MRSLVHATPRPLFDEFEPMPDGRRPWKRQRQTARAAYAARRAEDQARAAAGHETRAGQVLRLLAAHWNATQQSPTGYELFAFAQSRGEQLFDVNSIRPQLTRLVADGLVEARGKRRCRVSGRVASAWAIREAGSREAR